MGKKQVTFADIAAYTNFSKTTISRYFNHPDSLTLENQEKISQALDTLGYKKNKLAKVLANGKSEFIGIIIPNLYLHYYSEMLTQILSSYRDFHYKFLVFVSDNGPSEEEQYIDELMAYQIEGLIVLSHTLSSEKLASYQIPVIAIEREAEHICGVTSDNYMGALQAATLLIRDKCDVLIHVNADVPKSIPAYDRIHNCQESIRIFGKSGLKTYLHRYHWRGKSPSFCQGTSHQYQRKCASSVQKCPDKNPLLHLNSVHKERDIPDRYLQRHGYGHRTVH